MMNILKGHIISKNTLSATISPKSKLIGELSKPIGYINYNGTYEITPKTKEQIIETENKHMSRNMLIKEIPFYEVSNEKGETIIIGGDI